MDQDGDVPEVRPPTIDDVRRICRALEEAGARYVLIGGFAVILHGGHRTTKDIDVADEVMVELLAAACGVTWSEAHSSAKRIDLGGTPVIIADRDTLIRTKRTARRPARGAGGRVGRSPLMSVDS